MDIQNFFMSPKPYHIFLMLIIFINLANHVLSLNAKYQDCSPRTCGNGPNISYPFWITDEQQPFCGYPNFDITCRDKNPVLTISNDDYIIKDIFYSNHSLLVANYAVYEDTCPTPLYNISLERTPFSLSLDHSNFSIFYNCTSEPDYPTYRLDCASNGTHSFAVLHEEGLERKNYSLDWCDSLVDVPLDILVGLNFTSLLQMSYTEVLKIGFLLNWIAPNCSSCQTSGGRCGSDNNEFVCFKPKHEKSSEHLIQLTLSLGVSLFVVVAAVIVYVKVCKKRGHFLSNLMVRERGKKIDVFKVEEMMKNFGSIGPKRYTYSDVKKMSNSFNDKVGQGGFGIVYKGRLLDGRIVAIKVLSKLKGNGEDFINEVASISRTSHVNIVTLLGFCFEMNKRALIFEFMPNGSLDKFIHGKGSLVPNGKLDINTMFKIVIGIARGLEYLHRGCNTRILHFDIKPHNILLDEDLCPKISDFGLAKLCKTKESIVSMMGMRGTPGYIAPEIFSRHFGGVSHKSDVYSYGMLILEMVGIRKNFDNDLSQMSDVYFPHGIYNKLHNGESFGMFEDMIEEEEETIKKMTIVSLWCIQINPSDRPSMGKVIEMLEGTFQSLPFPPKPYLESPRRLPHDSSTASLSQNLTF